MSKKLIKPVGTLTRKKNIKPRDEGKRKPLKPNKKEG